MNGWIAADHINNGGALSEGVLCLLFVALILWIGRELTKNKA